MKRLIFIIRAIKKSAYLNTIVILSMALGLFVAGLILSHVYQEFHYDSGVANADRIYRISEVGGGYAPLARALVTDYPEVKEVTRVSFFYGYLACATERKMFNETCAIFTDPNFFEFFSFPIIQGDQKTCLQTPNSIVLSETAAHKYFGNSDPIGKPIRIGKNGQYTVTGIFQDFKSNSNFRGDLILPLKSISKLTQIWVEPSWDYESDIHTFVLLTENAHINQLTLKIRNFVSEHTSEKMNGLRFQPLRKLHIESDTLWESTPQANTTYLYVLIAIAILILFISSANFLFLFVGIKAQKSINTGIKKVCGASRPVLFLEYFSEVLVLMFLSVILAVVFYVIYHNAISSYFSFLPRVVFFDSKLLLLLLTIIIAVAVMSGIYPALGLSSKKYLSIPGLHKANTIGQMSLVNKLVIVQFTLCIALIASTIITHKQVHFMESRDTGYAKGELLTIPLNMHVGNGINNGNFETFAQELRKYPGIKNVTMSFSSPAAVTTTGATPDWQGKPAGKEVMMHWESVAFDYFKTIGVSIVQGRSFSPDHPGDVINWDTHEGAYVLNQSAVRAMGIHDPIGKEFSVWGFKGPIIGVVEDYNFQSMRSQISPMFYEFNPFYLNEIVVRINRNLTSVLSDIQNVWHHFVPTYPLEYHFVSDKINELYYPERNLARSLDLFSFLAVVIATMGLFALTLLSLNRRVKEIGIRKTLGASVTGIIFLLSKDFLKMVLLANIIAVPLAWYAMSRWLGNFAYKVHPSTWQFLIAGVFVLTFALLTVSWQAVRAATANPVESLRYE